MSKKNPLRKAKVKATGKEIDVYKLKDGGWCIFLGDKLTMSAIENNEHQKTFKDDELEFVK